MFRDKDGRLPLDKLGWLIMGVFALVVLGILIFYFQDALFAGAKKFFKIFGSSFGG